MTTTSRLALASALALGGGAASEAQTCPCPPTPGPGWHGSAGAGIALTGGNSDTQSYNANLGLVYDPQKTYRLKIDGLYLKSRVNGADTSAKSAAGARAERKLGRAFLFAETRYERDAFKSQTYLFSPTAGLGYTLADGPRVKLGVDAGAGFAIEKLSGRDGTTSGALRAGESLSVQLSDTARLTHSSRALWKTDDFADAFYHVEAGIAASVSQRLELKLDTIVDVKNKPAAPGLEKTDRAVLASLVFKL